MTIRSLATVFVAGLLVSIQIPTVLATDLATGPQAATDQTSAALPADKQRYTIPMQGCVVEFVARKGGRTAVGSGAVSHPYGYFSHDQYFPNSKGRRSLSFTLSCQPGTSAEICPSIFKDYRELSPEDIRDTQMHKMGSLNSHYHTEAYIVTATGVPTPRSRILDLCIGDDTRTLVTENGGIALGYDPREIWQTRGKPVLPSSEATLPEVLEIIRSIRLVPENAK